MKTTTVKNLFLILTIVGSFVLAQRVFGAAAVTQESARVPYQTRGVYGQSFTAPDTGTITRIEVYLAASGRNTNLRIYAGERSPNRPGAAVYVQNGIPIVCSDCWLSVPLVTPVSVKAGARYTFEFTDVAPYANPGNPYAGGRAWINGVSSASTDLGFRISLGASLAVFKSVLPNNNVPYHSVVTYTVFLQNSGSTDDPNVIMTDTLPSGVAFGQWLTAPPSVIQNGNAITWTGTVTSSSTLTFAFTATHIGNFGDVITNVATFSGTTQTGNASAAFNVVLPTLAIGIGGTGNGTVTPTVGLHTYPVGTIVTLQATPNVDSTFTSWSGDADCLDGSVTMNADKVCVATFLLKTYVITPTAGANGSITPGVPQTVNYGGNQSFTIAPNTGYHIADVRVDGGSIGVVNAYTFTNVTSNHTLSAAFAINTYLITPTAGANGTITPATPQTVNYGSNLSFIIAPNTGYHIADVGVDGGSIGVTTTYTFNNVTANHTITAAFAINTYLITPTAGANGTITPSTPQTVTYGGKQSFIIAPNTGYHIADVGVDGVSIGAVSVYTFTAVAANHTISAAFAINTYVITPTAGAGGSITPGTPQTVDYGSSKTFTITPGTGYHIVDVGVDTSSIGVTTTYTFNNITADHTITAAFAIDTFIITPTAGANGAITPSTPQTVNYGGTQAFTMTPNVGYHVADVGVDGISVGMLNVYTFSNVTANHTITAAFSTNDFTLTIATAGNGSGVVTPTVGTHPYSNGDIVVLEAVANIGSTFMGWSGDTGCDTGSVTMTANKSCTATFTLQTFTLTIATAGNGYGVVTPTVGTHAYDYGTVVALQATPSVSSTFTGWSGDVGCASGSVTIDANKVCTATFALQTFTLTIATTGNGSGVVTPTIGTHSYDYGTVVALQATPNTGSTFMGWSGDAGCAGASVTMNANKSCIATFTLRTYTLTIATAGNGSGVVTPTVGIHPYNYGTIVALQATANTGSTFIGWSGDVGCASGSVTVDANKACTATFIRYFIFMPLVAKNYPGALERSLFLPFIVNDWGP